VRSIAGFVTRMATAVLRFQLDFVYNKGNLRPRFPMVLLLRGFT
jgi:hypothetical protein